MRRHELLTAAMLSAGFLGGGSANSGERDKVSRARFVTGGRTGGDPFEMGRPSK